MVEKKKTKIQSYGKNNLYECNYFILFNVNNFFRLISKFKMIIFAQYIHNIL